MDNNLLNEPEEHTISSASAVLDELQMEKAVVCDVGNHYVQDSSVEGIKDAIIGILKELHAENVVLFTMNENSHFGEYVLAASTNSSRQSRAISEQVIRRVGKTIGAFAEGEENGDWVVVKIDVVTLHVLKKEVREYYDVDGLWKKVCLSHVEI